VAISVTWLFQEHRNVCSDTGGGRGSVAISFAWLFQERRKLFAYRADANRGVAADGAVAERGAGADERARPNSRAGHGCKVLSG